jgi:hypothetical protein
VRDALAGAAALVGGRRREAVARSVLTAATAETANELVAQPVDEELAALAETQDLIGRLG